ncbi:MAG: efflux RND transporter permease subunit [Bacteroidota bacterium]
MEQPPPPWLEKKTAKRVLLMVGLLSLLAFWGCTYLQFNSNLLRFFPENQQEISFYESFRERFITGDHRTMVAIEAENHIFEPGFLPKISTLSEQFRALPWVEKATGLTDLYYEIPTPFGPQRFPFVHPDRPELWGDDSLRLAQATHLMGVFVSEDFKSLTFQLFTDFDLSPAATDSLAEAIERLVAGQNIETCVLAGRLLGQAHILHRMQVEMAVFILLAALMILVALWWIFRFFWGMMAPLIVVLLTALWVLGLMGASGQELDVLSSLIPAILFIIGVSDTVHIFARYLEELNAGQEKIAALWRSYQEVGRATFITSLTTAIGFLSLNMSSIAPIREFGIFTALGVMIAFVLSFTLFPALLIMLPEPSSTHQQRLTGRWDPVMLGALSWVLRKRRPIGMLAILITGLSIVGLSQLEVNNYLTEELPENDPVQEGFIYFEENYGGVRTFDLAIQLRDSSRTFWDWEVMQQLESLQDFATQHYEIRQLFCLPNVVRLAHQYLNGGTSAQYLFPEQATYQKLLPVLQSYIQQDSTQALIGASGLRTRMAANLLDEGGRAMRLKHPAFYAFAEENCPDLSIELTGMAHLIDLNNRYIVRDMLRGLGLAFVLISLIMAYLFRSPKMIVIAAIPNVLPLVLVAGFMYITGIDLKVSTCLIFTLAFGIAVDDTIHFLSKVKLDLQQGKSLEAAIQHAFISTGKAIILTSLILCAGFISLSFSTFTSTHYLGMLISLSLLLAVVVDLLLLPILLRWLKKREQ